MKKILFIPLFLLIGFSCKKAEVRKGIEGIWKIEKFQYSLEVPWGFSSGTYEFGECSRIKNKETDCIVSRTFISYNTVYDTIYPERTQTYNFQILKKGEEIIIGDTPYQVDLNEDILVLKKILEWKGLGETITLSRL